LRNDTDKVIWTPQPGPQTAFLTCPHEECLYGGAAGGGKSDALIGDYVSGVEQYGSAWKGVLIRKSFPQLEELESRALQILGPHYGVSSYKRGSKTWYLETRKGTAELRLRAMEANQDAYKVHGHQFSWIGFDELTMWASNFIYEYLKTRLRSPEGAPCYMRSATNPGGPGHHWVKKRFRIGEVPEMEPFKVKTPSGRVHYRVFIPAKLTDNKILMKNDPQYFDRLDNMSDPVLRRAYLMGDWNITQGAAFPEFNPEVHVIDDYPVPDGVQVTRTCDWGYTAPYACLWYYQDYDGKVIVSNELYGCKEGKPDVGVQHDPETVWGLIRSVEDINGYNVLNAWLDPQCWAEHGGPSIFSLLGGYKAKWRPWPKGKTSRVNGKLAVHDFLKVVNGAPRILIMRKCENLIRTLQAIPLDPMNIEDVDTKSEDHLYDALRGGLSSRRMPTREEIRGTLADSWLAQFDKEESTEGKFGGW
jgi:Terminase large subunit, T4likevirus-type, N-terminal